MQAGSIVIIQGSVPLTEWQDRLAPHDVATREIERTSWVLREGQVWCLDATGPLRVAAVVWRVGATRPTQRQRDVLGLLRLAGVPCINSARALLAGFERVEMLAELRELGLPLPPIDLAIGEGAISKLRRTTPFVIKVGNYHGGFGKLLVEDAQRWPEYADLLVTANTYVASEPFVQHARDVRCLRIGEHCWAIERRGRSWRANVDTLEVRVIEPPEPLVEWSRCIAEHRGLDMLGLDALETDEGWLVLEVNDVPGLRGFPDAVLDATAERVLAQLG